MSPWDAPEPHAIKVVMEAVMVVATLAQAPVKAVVTDVNTPVKALVQALVRLDVHMVVTTCDSCHYFIP